MLSFCLLLLHLTCSWCYLCWEMFPPRPPGKPQLRDQNRLSHTHTHRNAHTLKHTYTPIHTYTHTYTTYTHVYTHTHTHTHIHRYIHTHIYSHTYIYTEIHTHSHTQAFLPCRAVRCLFIFAAGTDIQAQLFYGVPLWAERGQACHGMSPPSPCCEQVARVSS